MAPFNDADNKNNVCKNLISLNEEIKSRSQSFTQPKVSGDRRRKISAQENLPNKMETDSSEFVKPKLKRRSRKVDYIDGAKKRNYNELFYDILPYVSPVYTPLKDPPVPNLVGVDTNQGWLNNMSESRLNEFLDVTLMEKNFFLLWNSFIMKRINRSVGCAGLPTLLENFITEFGVEILKRNLFVNFVLHCACLRNVGYISQDQMFDSILSFENMKSQVVFPSKPPQYLFTSKNNLSDKQKFNVNNIALSERQKSLRSSSKIFVSTNTSTTSISLTTRSRLSTKADEKPNYCLRKSNIN